MIQLKKDLDDKDLPLFFDEINKTSMRRSNFDKFAKALQHRSEVLSLWQNDQFVGFGTMLTDYTMYSIIFEVVVAEEFKNKGYGTRLMNELMDCAPGTRFYLTSTFGHEGFYKKLGFKKHKTGFALYPGESDYLEEIKISD